MNLCVFIIFSMLLLCFETPTANQLVAAGDDTNGVVNKCLDTERHTLLRFKSHLEDPNGCLSTWRAEEHDCCTWIGVECSNQTGHVEKLEISCGIVGEIGHLFLNLSYLNHLSLPYNHLNGTIPAFIGSMTRLRYINLNGNHFHGTIPRFICSLTQLMYLDLADNLLFGIIPPELGNLTNMQVLFLESVGRSRVENIEWLSHLSGLQQLSMVGISLAKADHWVNVVTSLQNLSWLIVEGCELSQVMSPYTSFLKSSSSIELLSLKNNNLNSSMYRWLFPLTSNKLSLLYLSGNMLDGILKYLGNLCSLDGLTFVNNSVVVIFPDFLYNLSGCTSLALHDLDASGSQITGSLTDDIQKFSSLRSLDLSHNQLNGTISEELWKLPSLQYLDLSSSYLRGAISENIVKSKTFVILLSNNSLTGVPSVDHMSNLSYVQSIDLSSCKLGPLFPKWIQTLKNLTYLDISNNRISDSIPLDFWGMWPNFEYLNLSSNQISGIVPDLISNPINYSAIDLSSNNFYGPIPNVPSSLSSLNLSRNKFSGGLSFLCKIVDGLLSFLDLSRNSLIGQLPDCLWHFKELQVLNLGYNNLFGKLPPSIGYLIELEVLYLYKNNFSGGLPLSLKNCTSLNSLNLGANNFSGDVPVWIGENLSGLYVLILGSNHFLGTIPLQLCQLPNLQILDLSINNLHGTIPSCLNNLTSMVQAVDYDRVVNVGALNGPVTYVDHAMLEWQGYEREFFSTLRLLKSIDLSSNNLTGRIPYEITNLSELISLNLSKNSLHGEIPEKIGQMKKLLTLDLSRNSLSGGIPSSMSEMTLLNDLDVSFNNLSGRIPRSTQLQSFQPSRYDGNLGLCGPPLTKKCPGDEESKLPPTVGKRNGDGEDTNELWGWFYIGGGIGFATGFWIACGFLLLNRRGRHGFFHFYDSFIDWVYVKVVVFIANL